jgi:hypothetical protein
MKKSLLLLFIFLIPFSMLIAQQRFDRSPESLADEYLIAGMDRYRCGNYDDAVKYFYKILYLKTANPDEITIPNNLYFFLSQS